MRLSEEQLKQIVEIQLAGLRGAAGGAAYCTLELSDAARTRLVRSGYDPNYGARPLKRAIQREIETPLAKRLLAGEIRQGQTVWIDADPEGSSWPSARKKQEQAVSLSKGNSASFAKSNLDLKRPRYRKAAADGRK